MDEYKGPSHLGQKRTKVKGSENNYTGLLGALKSLKEKQERNFSVLQSMLNKLDRKVDRIDKDLCDMSRHVKRMENNIDDTVECLDSIVLERECGKIEKKKKR